VKQRQDYIIGHTPITMAMMETVKWFKARQGQFPCTLLSTPSPSLPLLVSFIFTCVTNYLLTFCFLYRSFLAFVQAGRRSTFPALLSTYFSCSIDSANMITSRFATVAFVALLGIVNVSVSGFPVWPQLHMVRDCCVVFG
jgi:hypothetical protein